ncbi:MAG: hypothetical protein ACTSVV_12095, partial [Promethearchaeota archaeon]
MEKLPSLKDFILYKLDHLPVENAYHLFERICFELTKLNITENVIPASGPVGRKGDQGRDFLSFKTYLDHNLKGNSNFLEKSQSQDYLVFTCSLQANIQNKIRSDVKKIVEFGLPVESIYFFSGKIIDVGTVNNLRKWAFDNHKVNLEILDGNAIADLLCRLENQWIAKDYLKIPEELFNSKKNFQEIQFF